jgi:DNA repair exonuclease SbcCD ATPase subunit
LEEFEDEFEMHFTQPHELVEYFGSLEEKSLFLIQMNQDAEQNLEELKAEYKKKKEELENKIKNLQETKIQKRKILDVINLFYLF